MILQKVDKNKYLLPKSGQMKADVVLYANDKIAWETENDLSLQQLREAASLDRVVTPVIGMPDIHQGFGLPIGGIMATEGTISVGAVGMDINCGVRLLLSPLEYDPQAFSQQSLKNLISQIERIIPTGLGSHHQNLPKLSLEKIISQGVNYLAGVKMANEQDIQHTEEYGCMKEAKLEALSERALNRAAKQLGTLGSGNHFIEILKIDTVIDADLANQLQLFKNQICIMIHSGSRALGHQTCLDYTNLFWKLKDKYNLFVPQKGLASLPIESKEGQNYFGAMAACVNFAFCNRQLMTYYLRQVFQNLYKIKLDLLYDVAHNIAKWEEHRSKRLLIHRKGATRALPAGHPQNPLTYRKTGHPALIPGSMATPSYVVVGLKNNKDSYHSVNHGAGRCLSRRRANREITIQNFEKAMENVVCNKALNYIKDEAPQVYKDIESVVNVLAEIDFIKKVVKLVPLAVVVGI